MAGPDWRFPSVKTQNAFPLEDIRVPLFENTTPTVTMLVFPHTVAASSTVAGSTSSPLRPAKLMAHSEAGDWYGFARSISSKSAPDIRRLIIRIPVLASDVAAS
jgi:hypothetical protein